jgi:hypothetical protein
MPRAYQLTINNVEEYEPILLYLRSLSGLRYMIACKEIAPITKREHIHVYVQFQYSLRLSKVKLLHAHIEVCRGNAKQNISYIKKQGNIILEEGEAKIQGNKLSIKEVKGLTKEEREELPFFYLKKVEAINQSEMNVMDAKSYFKHVEVYYIHGDSGLGKTKYAIDKIVELYSQKKIKSTKFNEVKYSNGFWVGVNADNITDVALYDDFRDSHMRASEFINFIDYNTHNMNIKYGSVKNTFKYIYITSIQSPDDIYSEYGKKNVKQDGGNLFGSNINNKVDKDDKDEPKKQWLRRFKEIIHLNI